MLRPHALILLLPMALCADSVVATAAAANGVQYNVVPAP